MNKLERLERTEFTGPKRDITVPWPVCSPFDNRSDPDATDKEWEKIGKIRLGVIALPDSYVEEKGLRKAQRFPWDNSKGLKLRISLLEFHRGEERSGIFAHVIHCLNALKQDIKFNADDIPDGLAMDIVSPADPPNSRGHFLPETATNYDHSEVTVGTGPYWGMIETGLALVAACLPTSRSKNTGSSAKGARSAKQYYKMDQMSIAASKVSTGAQFGGVEANFSTEEHFKGDVEAAELRP
ncbi:hypothetical protein BELL_0046g00090 [Botrytis elliptica]|uniref:Uncharacterized protein n=1 Tax=Botrytis elliptica TaxID=278938 RepID=A0A4Z1JYM0_9HELO|nr:hypothetical protein BELL_0046g00090 [Botrytis elliptica]